jgi:ATP-dependent Zn protease
MPDPRSTAIHEAGHAVVAWSFGLPVRAIRLTYSDAKGWHGGTDTDKPDHLSLVEQIEVCAAGGIAEEIFDCPTRELATFSDNVQILHLLEAHGISEQEGLVLRREGYNRAQTRLEAHRTKVGRLAERLVECGRIDASEFLQLMQANNA